MPIGSGVLPGLHSLKAGSAGGIYTPYSGAGGYRGMKASAPSSCRRSLTPELPQDSAHICLLAWPLPLTSCSPFPYCPPLEALSQKVICSESSSQRLFLGSPTRTLLSPMVSRDRLLLELLLKFQETSTYKINLKFLWIKEE